MARWPQYEHIGLSAAITLWLAVAILFFGSLWCAAKLTQLKIDFRSLLFVAFAASLATLVPWVGQILCFLLAIYLIYQLSDGELQQVTITVVIARFIVFLALLSVFDYYSQKHDAERKRELQLIEKQILDSQARTNKDR